MPKYILTIMRYGRQCLLVRVPGQHQRLFAPEDYETMEQMQEAAQAHADVLVAANHRLPLARRAKTGSESGVPGVRLKDFNGKPHWIAEWFPSPGRSVRKTFSVRKYGYEGAKKLALAEREAHVPTQPMPLEPQPPADQQS